MKNRAAVAIVAVGALAVGAFVGYRYMYPYRDGESVIVPLEYVQANVDLADGLALPVIAPTPIPGDVIVMGLERKGDMAFGYVAPAADLGARFPVKFPYNVIRGRA